MNSIKIYGYVLLVVALLVASSMPIAFKLGSAVPLLTLLFYISIVGTIVSLLMMLAKRSTPELKKALKSRNQFMAIFLIGIFAFTMVPLGVGYATRYISADLTSVIYRTWPILLLLLAPFVMRERISRWALAGVVIGFLGLGVTLIGGTAISIPIAALPFVGVVLLVALSDALATAISKRFNYELTSSIFLCNVITLIIFASLAMYTNALILPIINANVIIAILFLGVMTQAVFAFMFYESLRLVNTSLAGNAYLIVPFLTMLFSALLLGEVVQPYYIVIVIAVVAGVFVQKLAPKGVGNFVVRKNHKSAPAPIFDITSAFTNTKQPQVYQTMKGNGRVLAFYVDNVGADMISREQLDHLSGDDCMIFTDKHSSMASNDEIGFIREIMGCDSADLLVMGSGDPDKVMDRFSEVNSIINGTDGIEGIEAF